MKIHPAEKVIGGIVQQVGKARDGFNVLQLTNRHIGCTDHIVVPESDALILKLAEDKTCTATFNLEKGHPVILVPDIGEACRARLAHVRNEPLIASTENMDIYPTFIDVPRLEDF